MVYNPAGIKIMNSKLEDFEFLRSGEGRATIQGEYDYYRVITLAGALLIPLIGHFYRLPGTNGLGIMSVRWVISIAFAALFTGSIISKSVQDGLYRYLVGMYHIVTMWFIMICYADGFSDHIITMLAVSIAIEFNLFKRMKDIVSFTIMTFPVVVVLRIFSGGDMNSIAFFCITFSVLYAFMAWAQYQKIKVMHELEISRSLSTTILDRAGDALFLMDRHTFTVVYANASAASMVDSDDPSMLNGRTCGDILSLPDEFADRQGILTVVYRNGVWMKEVEFVSAGGDRFYVEMVIREVPISGMDFLLLRVTDITTKHRAEEEFHRQEEHYRQVQKHEALGKLAAGLAHELNNPLTVILGFAQGLGKRLADTQWAGPLANIEREARRARDLVEHLMVFSRETLPRRLQPVDVNKCAQRVLDLLKGTLKKHRIEVVHNMSEDLPGLMDAGEVDVSQIILNLCHNTIDAMPEGGILTVSTEKVKTPEGLCIRIGICDTGIGIREEYRSRIFEPFFTTKIGGQGSGLGLAVVFDRVESLKGSIEVVSRPSGGTCMHVTLPVRRKDEKRTS